MPGRSLSADPPVLPGPLVLLALGPGTGTREATAVTGRSPLDALDANQSPPHRRRHHCSLLVRTLGAYRPAGRGATGARPCSAGSGPAGCGPSTARCRSAAPGGPTVVTVELPSHA